MTEAQRAPDYPSMSRTLMETEGEAEVRRAATQRIAQLEYELAETKRTAVALCQSMEDYYHQRKLAARAQVDQLDAASKESAASACKESIRCAFHL